MVEHVANHVFRTVLMYFLVFGVMRIMGKREIGELSIFDLVISIMIAEIAVFALEDIERPLYDGVIPMLTLLLIQIVIAMLSLRFRKLRLWFDGEPSVIIQNGQINRKEMKRQRYNLDDLMMQLRSQQIDSVADVEFAVLETSGQLSVIPKEKSGGGGGQPTKKKDADLSAKIKYEALPLPLIMDGKVNDENLRKIGKTRFWLKNQIQMKGLMDFKQVFFCSIDHNGKLYINAMDEKQ
ncbi:Uncharacterized membrane protein YcaP, DUF421 family [Paenibacillus barengoltzii J12]|uniref:Uncharacterized membrane protein YcaP, DUF421 family n=2 Tax=Paenibacillus barengoltzii TaxID=343517 RepID=A0ABY1LSM8_9BACL|nr:DUF421 domain-containing protein [Paenibacillus barengoltzii]SME92674.1 Uncharacterized membrane protein YcaP, DUF421 family [Paenibacillus barengoltzii J12]